MFDISYESSALHMRASLGGSILMRVSLGDSDGYVSNR